MILNKLFQIFFTKQKNWNFQEGNFFGLGSNVPIINQLQNDFELIKAYNDLIELRSPISFLSSLLAKPIIKLYYKDKEVITHPILYLLNNPNQQDSYKEFIQKYFVFYFLLGNSYINMYTPIGWKSPTKLFILSSQYVKLILSQETDIRLKKVIQYIYDFQDSRLIINADDVLHKKIVNINKNSFYGESPFISGKYNITSLKSAYSTKCSLYQHGAKLILTPKGNEFIIPTNEQIKIEQDRINNDYGLTEGQYQIMLSKFPFDVTQISSTVDNLKIFESIETDFKAICRILNIDTSLLSDNDNSTYNNLKEKRKNFIQNNVIPLHEDFVNDLNNSLLPKFEKSIDYKLKGDYTCFSELNDNLEITLTLLNQNIITIDEARERLNLGIIPTNNKLNENERNEA